MSHTKNHSLTEHDLSALAEGTVQVQSVNGVKTLVTTPFSIYSGMPIGAIFQFAATAALPAGLLVCDGAAISRADYSALFAVIGTLYGAGDGSTTFNLPDFRGRVAQGTPANGTTGTNVAAGLPEIAGSVNPLTLMGPTGYESAAVYGGSGALGTSANKTTRRYHSSAGTTTAEYSTGIKFSAAASNSIYGNSDTVQPPAIHVQYVIVAL